MVGEQVADAMVMNVGANGGGFQSSNLAPANHDLDTTIAAVRRFRDSELVRPAVAELAEALAAMEGSSANTAKNKVYTAAKYGLVGLEHDRDRGRNAVVLLPLGEDVLDPQKARVAKVRAFLNVPVNRIIYSLFSSRPLPTSGAEWAHVMREIVRVAAGQIGPARRSIMRSARQAGLLEQTPDRLVIPPDVSPMIDVPLVDVPSPEVEDDKLREGDELHQEERAVSVHHANGLTSAANPPAPVVQPVAPVVDHAPQAATVEAARRPVPDPAIIEWWLVRKPRTGASKAKWVSWLKFLNDALDLEFDDDDTRA